MLKLLNGTLWKDVSSLQRKVLFQAFGRAATTTAVEDSTFATAKPIDQIPGFRSLPFIGTSWVFFPIVGKYSREEVAALDRDKYLRFGDISKDVYGGQYLINVYNEKDVETVLRNESKQPNRGILNTLKKYRETRKEWYKTLGVILTQGQEWYDLRFKLQKPMMRPDALGDYIKPSTEVNQDLIKVIVQTRNHNNEVPDMMDHLFNWSLESIAYATLDARLGCLDPNASPDSDGRRIIDTVQIAFECMNYMENITGNVVQFWKYFPTPTWRKYVKNMDTFSEIAFRYVQQAVKKLKAEGPKVDNPTLLQAMLSSRNVEPHEAVTMSIDMMLGGIDTTSNTCGYLLYHLAKNPEKQKKLYQEIIKLLPSPSDQLTYEILSKMRYLKLCLKEAIRLHPVPRGLTRITERDLVLSGYYIPKGTLVFCQLQTCCRMEKHFKNADQFIPERWADRENKPSPFLYMPFGFGTRSCIGRRMAELEIYTLTTEIMRRFKVEYHCEDFKLRNRLVNIPDRPLKFTFLDRS